MCKEVLSKDKTKQLACTTNKKNQFRGFDVYGLKSASLAATGGRGEGATQNGKTGGWGLSLAVEYEDTANSEYHTMCVVEECFIARVQL